MSDLATDVQALQDAANTVVTAVETVVNDVDNQVTSTEDPVWTAVKAALTDGGWTAPAETEPSTDTGETPSA